MGEEKIIISLVCIDEDTVVFKRQYIQKESLITKLGRRQIYNKKLYS